MHHIYKRKTNDPTWLQLPTLLGPRSPQLGGWEGVGKQLGSGYPGSGQVRSSRLRDRVRPGPCRCRVGSGPDGRVGSRNRGRYETFGPKMTWHLLLSNTGQITELVRQVKPGFRPKLLHDDCLKQCVHLLLVGLSKSKRAKSQPYILLKADLEKSTKELKSKERSKDNQVPTKS